MLECRGNWLLPHQHFVRETVDCMGERERLEQKHTHAYKRLTVCLEMDISGLYKKKGEHTKSYTCV